MKRQISVALFSVLVVLGCSHKLPAIPQTPTAVVDVDVRATTMKALGIMQSAGVVVQKASSLEAEAFGSGFIPAATHQQIDRGFKTLSDNALKVIDELEHGTLTTWPAIRARVDPIVGQVRDLITTIGAAGPSWKDHVLDYVGAALAILMQLSNAGAFGGGLSWTSAF